MIRSHRFRELKDRIAATLASFSVALVACTAPPQRPTSSQGAATRIAPSEAQYDRLFIKVRGSTWPTVSAFFCETGDQAALSSARIYVLPGANAEDHLCTGVLC